MGSIKEVYINVKEQTALIIFESGEAKNISLAELDFLHLTGDNIKFYKGTLIA